MNRAQMLIDQMFLGEAPTAPAPTKTPTTTPTKTPGPSKPRPGTRPWLPTKRPDVSPKPKARGGEDKETHLKPRPKATDVGHYSSVSSVNAAHFAEADQAPVSVPPPPAGETGGPEPEPLTQLVDMIRPGDRVTIMSPHGSRLSGRTVMRSRTGGWVLNLGGAHGTPGLADDDNIIAISRGGKRIYGRI